MQSTGIDQTTRADIGELISEGQDMIEDRDYDMTGWAREIITALAAERDRADRAEARLAQVLEYADSTYTASTVARRIVQMGKATA